MADLAGISGIRATGLRPVAILKKEAALLIVECSDVVNGMATVLADA